MKLYHTVVCKLADRMFNEYMSGSNQPGYGIDTGLISFIYGIDSKKVSKDIDIQYELIKTQYYSRKK